MNNNLEENVKDIEYYIESIRNEIMFNDNISTSCIKYNLDEIQSILNKLKKGVK